MVGRSGPVAGPSSVIRWLVPGLIFATAASPAAALRVPLGDRLLEIEGALEGRAVVPAESGAPDEDPRGLLRLGFGLDVTRDFRLEVRTTSQAGGSPVDPEGAGVFRLDETLQDISPSFDLEEAYVDYYGRDVDVRVGLQKFAWGKLDADQPNDLLNPSRWYDPVLEDEDDRKIGVPAVKGSVYLPWQLRLTGAFVPILVPFRFPDLDERWFPPIARVPEESEEMGFTVRNEQTFRNTDLPERSLENVGGGLQLAGFLSGLDFSLYYYEGFDPQPLFDVDVTAFARLNPLSPQGVDVRSEVDLFPVYDRVRSAGLDLAYPAFGFTMRGEAAWLDGRLFPRIVRDVVAQGDFSATEVIPFLTLQEQEIPVDVGPVNFERDAVRWGLGIDRLMGDFFLLLEANQTVILDNEVDLLLSDWETQFVTRLRYAFWSNRLEAEITGLYGMQGVYGLGMAELTWQVTGSIDAKVGYLAIEGHEESLLGTYKRNDQGFGRVRLQF